MRPLEFSPCSRFLAIILEDGHLDGVHVLDEDLTTLSRTDPEYMRRHSLHLAWTPSSCCVVIECPPEYLDPYAAPSTHIVRAVWQAHQPDSSAGDESEHVNALFAAFCPGEVLQDFSCSPVAGYAAVTQVCSRTPNSYRDQHKLYVLQPGQAAASMVLAETIGCVFLLSGHVAWSPTGQHLLTCCNSAIELVTSTCKLVQAYDRPASKYTYCRGAAIFSPCGRQIAIFCGKCTLQVCRVRDGAVLFCREGGFWGNSQLSFSLQGDQLRLFGGGLFVATFGHDAGPSQRACHAVVSACSSVLSGGCTRLH